MAKSASYQKNCLEKQLGNVLWRIEIGHDTDDVTFTWKVKVMPQYA